MRTYEYLVVGSGCSGAMAAQTLVETGVDVAMLDVGVVNKEYADLVPDSNYLSLRETDPKQYQYFLGENGEGIDTGELGKGAQLTPARRHMLELVDKYIPLQSTTFSPLESLGYGGLGIGWGLQCWEFSSADLEQTGLSPERMRHAYEIVSGRIGISATKDAAAAYTLGDLKNYQPSPTMDRNHRLIQRLYAAHEERFVQQGFFLGRTPLALITEQLGDREGYKYQDMDFYSDHHRSAWRPWITVDALRLSSNFTYISGQLVTRFSEDSEGVAVHCVNTKTGKHTLFRCKKLLLASGVLGTARIVLRSLGKPSTKLPILCNPHSYVPYIQPSLIGKGPEPGKLGLGELSYFLDKEKTDSGLSIASSYGYQSLMLFRVINQAPIALADARILMRYLLTGLVIMIIQHPDSTSSRKYLKLVKAPDSITGDKLYAHFDLTSSEAALWDKREGRYIKAMRKLHTYAIKRTKTPHGSSVHYAGALPFSAAEKEFRLTPAGRLHGTRNVYMADSSGFNYLPAKGLTFSLMANAHLVAENALKHEG